MQIPNFSSAGLLVVGDVMLDKYWYGKVSRISPEAPVPVVQIEEQEARVGGAGNVALNAAALGANTQLLGLIGEDPSADQIEKLLGEQRVSCQLQRVAGSKTITKLRILSRQQQLIRLDFEDQFPGWNDDALIASFSACINSVDAVVLSDYAKGILRRTPALIQIARNAGKPIIIDPKGTDFDRYRDATLITPNLAEFEAVVGYCSSEAEIVKRGIALRERLNLGALVITRSEKGMTLLANGHAPLHLPTQAREVFDVTGAGDTVLATLGVAIAIGVPLPDAVSLANASAGVVVSKLGTATVSAHELQYALHRSARARSVGVLDEDTLHLEIMEAKALGERIVMTNGCFDILHPGHIDYLEKARALGDRLIVAVNNDDSVRRLKGVGRPVNSLETRMRILASLSCVDCVVPFTEDTPERLIRRLMPDILVKGGDYTEEEVVGGEFIKAVGGEVSIIGFLQGHSTTDIINRIKKGSS